MAADMNVPGYTAALINKIAMGTFIATFEIVAI